MKPQARTDIQTLLKNVDDVETPMDPSYYKKLHDKIMMKIDEKQESMDSLPTDGRVLSPSRLAANRLGAVIKKMQSVRR